MPPRPYAHTLPDPDERHWESLADHLRAVAAGAEANAEPFGWGKLANVAGLLHDAGKASDLFQAYLRGQAPRGGDHATAGAREALAAYGPALGGLLAAVIAGHHSGLSDADGLDRRLASVLPPYDGWAAETGALPPTAALRPARTGLAGARVPPSFQRAFLVRMLFSCLVDADFIATETFMAGGKLPRGVPLGMPALRDSLLAHLASIRNTARPINALRAEIMDHALARAADPPGFFTLTVPTGGGKTFASLAFALQHAVLKQKRRVVVVVPFTAIIEQTAAVYREALGAPDAVLEHHSSFDWEDAGRGQAGRTGDGGDERDGLGRLRRAAENWDAPVVVTTAVQFFESLYANRTSRCRKLHNLAESVIVLDEAQATPPRLLLPCLMALDELRRGYGASIVLCTATQPAWRAIDGALVFAKKDRTTENLGLEVDGTRELAPRPRALFAALRRVEVEVIQDPLDDAALAEAFARAPQMLCIVNSRAHARDMFERIRALDGAVHLTTLMCPAHRRQVLGSLPQRLTEGEPVRLVATSLIEAGVDISFPEVWRASAGLDSIAQAAGRCNREGLLPALGRVVVFTPSEAQPPAALRDFQQAARTILRDSADPLGMAAITDYYRALYGQKDRRSLDAALVKGRPGILDAIEESKQRVPFESVADAFRMIDDTMRPVIVPWNDRATAILDRLAAGGMTVRRGMRELQPFAVGIPERAWLDWLGNGSLMPIAKELGDTVLKLTSLAPLYASTVGLELSNGKYRTAEENLW